MARSNLLFDAVHDSRSDASLTDFCRDVCSSLRHGAFVHEVPVYLNVLESVETQNQGVSSSISHQRVPLYDAHDAHRRLGGA